MKKYESPIVMINEDLAEGVYAASGEIESSGCMTVKAYISQGPEGNAQGKYVVWIESNHDGSLYYGGDGHTASGITVTLNFNQAVTLDAGSFYQPESGISCSIVGGNGTASPTLHFDAAVANAGTKFWGQIFVSAGDGLALNSSSIKCHPVY